MINVQVMANRIMHWEFGTRFSRDINPCATMQSAGCLLAQVFSSVET
jgi:hypothetical protein